MRPLMLDLYCRRGGAAVGYHRAGFDVIGVDIEDHSDGYPFEFHQDDALEFLRAHGRDFDVVHASPPCQGQIAITAGNRGRRGWEDGHVNLLPATREALAQIGRPSVMENGPSKHIRPDTVLCGLMFGLPTIRHRSFEIEGWVKPWHPHLGPRNHRGHLTIGWRHGCLRTVEPSVCPKHGSWCRGTVYGVYGKGGGKPTVPEAQLALGIDWMDRIEDLNEAIPPAFTEFLGHRLLDQLRAGVAA